MCNLTVHKLLVMEIQNPITNLKVENIIERSIQESITTG